MRALIRTRRVKSLIALLLVAFVVAWLYWNHTTRTDLSTYAPADCLAFVEANDLTELAQGIEATQAWKALAGPVGAHSSLVPNRWFIRLARWTGIGSAEAILLARSQVAVVFTGAEASQAGPTLTIKPFATLVIETHTTQRRMRPTLERHIEDLAKRVYGQPSLSRKQVDGVDLSEWSSADGARHIVAAFAGTAAIIGNDEPSVLHCLEARSGKRAALAGEKQLADLRQKFDSPHANVFGFVSKPGVKSLLQAYALYRAGSSSDAVTISRIFSETLGNLVDGFGWSASFVDGMVEERCSITLSQGVADKLRGSFVPEERLALNDLPFVPADAHSVSLYHFRDVEGVWRDLNAIVASHADLIGAIAARPMLRSLLKPYGIDDADTFVHSVGTRIQTIRLEETSPAVLVTEAFDRQGLRKVVQQRLGGKTKTENVGDFELILSSTDNWAASFPDNQFMIGPRDAVRRCLQAKVQSQSLTSTDAFRKSQRLVDVSLPITALTFVNDQHAAISFVELFSEHERSAFSTSATAIDEASRSLPYAVSVVILKDAGLEWTSRSSFGLVGSLLVTLMPEPAK
jgi:acyl-CoA-binding protein